MSTLRKINMRYGLSFKAAINMILTTLVICASVITVSAGAYRSSLEEKLLSTVQNVTLATASILASGADYSEVGQKLLEIQNYYDVDGLAIFYPTETDVICYYDYVNGEEEGVYPQGEAMSYEAAGLGASEKEFVFQNKESPFLTKNAACGMTVIRDESGTVLFCVEVRLSTAELHAREKDFVRRLLRVQTVLGIVLASLTILTVQRLLVKPIDELAERSLDFVNHHKSGEKLDEALLKIPEHIRKDEIGRLWESIYTMENDIGNYIENLTVVTAEKERIGTELNVATRIQASMLPSIFPPFPEREEFELYAFMEPAKEVGGDFYDFFLVDDDHLALVIADVSGKGVPAALFMVIAKTLLKNAAQQGLSPKGVLERVNAQLCEGNDAEMFVTVWIGIMEISTGVITCANAGHEYPALRKSNGTYELVKDKHGLVLAGMEGAKYREYTLMLQPGDSIYVYTDGVAEATDADNQLFGTERMTAALNQNPEATPKELLSQVKKSIELFVGDAPQFDDITMLTMLYRGNQPEQ